MALPGVDPITGTLGAVAGATGGNPIDAIAKFFGAKDPSYQIDTRSRFTPEQQALFELLASGGSEGQGNLRSLYESLSSGSGFEAGVQQPAIQAYNEKVLPSITRNFQRGLYSSDRNQAEQQSLDQLNQFLVQARAQDQARREGLQAQIGGAQANLLATLLGQPAQENIPIVDPGSPGLLPVLLQALGAGAGAYAAGA